MDNVWQHPLQSSALSGWNEGFVDLGPEYFGWFFVVRELSSFRIRCGFRTRRDIRKVTDRLLA